MSSGSYLYKHLQRIVSEWPVETGKGRSRNLKFLLEDQLERTFQMQKRYESQPKDDEQGRVLAPGVSVIECKRQLEALQQLANNQHKRDFPVPYTSGVLGYSPETIRERNSDKGLKSMRIFTEGEKPSRWKDIAGLLKREK